MTELPKSEDIRRLFDIPDGVTYLNCASLCPLLLSARQAAMNALVQRSRPWSIKKADADFLIPNEARGMFARLISSRPENIAIVGSSSQGVSVAANNISVGRGQLIVAPERQHPANVLAWSTLAESTGANFVRVPRPTGGDWTAPLLSAIDERTAVVAVPQCDWSDGMIVDLDTVARRARLVGAALVVDATQSIGVLPFDVTIIDPDFVVCSTFKWLLGPTSLAMLYVAPRWQHGRPLEHHGINRVGFLDPDRHALGLDVGREFLPNAERFDSSQRGNLVQLAQLNAGLQQVLEWGGDAIARRLAPLAERARLRAQSLGLSTIARRHGVEHIVGLQFAGTVPADMSSWLASHGVHASIRGGLLRLSPHLYNTIEDIDRAFDLIGTRVRHAA